ncbi:MAG: thioredoxin [Pseudomonadota bacterium]
MLELGKKAADQGDDLVKEVTDQTFMADVIEESTRVPVIVDFWAPWCGPCKTLGPELEKQVRAAKGAVKMAKVNVDQNQMIASQLRVQSIPAVFAFANGQPVDGFVGAVTPAEIKDFVARLAKDAGGGGLDEALEQAEEMLTSGAAADAAQIFAAVLGEDAENARALGGMVRAMLAVGDVDRARQALDMASPEMATDPAIQAARSALELAEQTQEAGEVAELRAKLEAAPDDHQARYDLSLALLSKDQKEDAVEALLELFRRDREWNDGAAKEQLLKIFESLGPKDPLTQKGRRRLSSMIFM